MLVTRPFVFVSQRGLGISVYFVTKSRSTGECHIHELRHRSFRGWRHVVLTRGRSRRWLVNPRTPQLEWSRGLRYGHPPRLVLRLRRLSTTTVIAMVRWLVAAMGRYINQSGATCRAVPKDTLMSGRAWEFETL